MSYSSFPLLLPQILSEILRRCLLICASLLLGFAPFLTCWDRPYLSLEEVTLESPSALLHPSFQGCILRDSSRQITEVSQVCFTQVQGCVLLFLLLPPLGIMNCTGSWLVQPSLPSTFTSMASSALFTSTKSSRVHFLVSLIFYLYLENIMNTLKKSLWATQSCPPKKIPWLMLLNKQGL